MSDLKVSDVFEHMIDFRLCEKGHIYCRFNDITDEALELVENAVISYDSNQDLIAKLQADNELLREALVRQRKVMSNAIELDVFHANYIDEASLILDGLDSVIVATAKG